MAQWDEPEYCNAASKMAGPADSGWNRRFVAALRTLGRELEPIGQLDYKALLGGHKDGYLMAPIPYEEGWKYPYPSFIVPIKQEVSK